MSEPSASVLARRRNAAAALKRAKDEDRRISNVILNDTGREARKWLLAHGWTQTAAVAEGLVLLMQRERAARK